MSKLMHCRCGNAGKYRLTTRCGFQAHRCRVCYEGTDLSKFQDGVERWSGTLGKYIDLKDHVRLFPNAWPELLEALPHV